MIYKKKMICLQIPRKGYYLKQFLTQFTKTPEPSDWESRNKTSGNTLESSSSRADIELRVVVQQWDYNVSSASAPFVPELRPWELSIEIWAEKSRSRAWQFGIFIVDVDHDKWWESVLSSQMSCQTRNTGSKMKIPDPCSFSHISAITFFPPKSKFECRTEKRRRYWYCCWWWWDMIQWGLWLWATLVI